MFSQLLVEELSPLEEFKKVKYDTVKLQQDYRDFDFESPWRGSEYIASEQKKVGKLKND